MMIKTPIQLKLKSSFERLPDRVALEYGNRQVTYGELDKKSGQIAGWIKDNGIKAGTFIGIYLEDKIRLIAIILGILKARCVFIPLDTVLPSQRIVTMIETTRIALLFTAGAYFQRLASHENLRKAGTRVISIDQVESLYPANGFSSWTCGNDISYDGDDKIYIYFTSGSTGIPKGIVGINKSLVHFIDWEIDTFGLDSGFCFSQLSAPGFDAFLRDVFVPLVTGGRLCIPGSRDLIMSTPGLIHWIDTRCLHLIHCVPGIFRIFNDETLHAGHFRSLQTILLAGERLVPAELKNWYERIGERVRLVNLYGTSETTMAKTAYFIQPADAEREKVPVGKAIKGARIILLDEAMKICGKGMAGEIYIRTPYRTAGYYDDPQLNAQRFIPNPFNGDPADLLHKTGDLGRLLPDGNLELIGRTDRQVKVRGVRVEPEEIENQLLKHPGVNGAVAVLTGSETGDENLCAYVTATDAGSFASTASIAGELRQFLANFLPDYMVPTHFTWLEKFPLTSNGKIDLKALPAPGTTGTGADEYVAPRDEVEKKLAGIWSEILHVTPIGIHDNFFHRGGHSFKAMILTARIRKFLQVNVPFAEVFNNPTIKSQADYIKGAAKSNLRLIEPVEEKEYYPVSSAQERLYILQQMELTGTVYNMPRIMTPDIEMDKERLREIFKTLIQRHESLRTSFIIVDEKPCQRVHPEVVFDIEVYDLTTGGEERKIGREEDGKRGRDELFGQIDAFAGVGIHHQETQKDTKQTTNRASPPGTHHSSFIIQHSFVRPFDLSRAPLLRVGLMRLPEGECLLLLDLHHIICDGVSQVILVKEFYSLYAGEELPSLPCRYKDYAGWQQGEASGQVLTQQEAYWLKEFAGEIPVLTLPLDYPRPAKQGFAGDRFYFTIDALHTQQLRSLAAREEVTLYILLLTLFNILMAKLSGEEDIVVGVPIAGRGHTDLEPLVGMFVNTMAVRHFPSGSKPFLQLLEEVKIRTLKAYENQDYPFADLLEKLSAKITRDMSRNPLFDVVWMLHNESEPMDNPGAETPGRQHTPRYQNKTSKFDIAFHGLETPNHIHLTVEYCTQLFKKKTIQSFLTYLHRVIISVLDNPAQRVLEIEIMDKKEKQKILALTTGSGETVNLDKTIPEWFEEQVLRTPDQTALIGQIPDKISVTYRELNEESQRWAQKLREKGVRPDTLVAIMLERSLEMIVGLLAILKAGGAYLPLNPEYPQERLKYMLKDSKVNILVNKDNNFGDFLVEEGIDTLSIDDVSFNSSRPKAFGISSRQGGQLAYTIYTSGSTGKPKGVLLQHRNVVRLVKGTNYMDWQEGDKLLLTGSIVFDITTFEIWGPLLNGLALCLVHQEKIVDAEKLAEILFKHQISLLHLIPQLFNQLAEQRLEMFAGLKYLLLGGDMVHPYYVNKVRNRYRNLKILHMYGPTENTTFSTFFPVEAEYEVNIPLGKPIGQTVVYIVDRYGKLQPPGVAGELWTGGEGVARGYLNNPELTDSKFRVPKSRSYKSYKSNKSYISKKIYKTGDLARWLWDGNIEFLGRRDSQVKIRGFRVELGEIENRLLKHDGIKEAVVLVRETFPGDPQLCAYFVSKRSDLAPGLKDYLSGELPAYMIPDYFIPLENLPLSPNGKVDRNALPKPGPRGSEKNDTAPRNELEKKLVDIWAEVLKVEKVGIYNDFFNLGGHSLKVLKLLSAIEKELQVKVNIRDLYTYPTIAGQSELVTRQDRVRPTVIPRQPRRPTYELSYAQKRLWMIYKREPHNPAYNLGGSASLLEAVDEDILRKVLDTLVQRHESFRTRFKEIKQEPVQIIEDAVEVDIEAVDLSHAGENEWETALGKYRWEERMTPFGLERAPLLRVKLLKRHDRHYELLFIMHHIITDGWSMEVLTREFMLLYERYRQGKAADLGPLEIQYKDYAAWHNRWLLDEEKVKKTKESWKNYLKGKLPVLNLPYDVSRLTVSTRSAAYRWWVPGELAGALQELASTNQSSLFMVLLAGFNILLSQLCGQRDIVLAVPAAARQQESLKNVIGMFVNTLVLRTFVDASKTFRDFFNGFRDDTFQVLEYQDYPMELIFSELKIKYPEIHVFFNMVNLQDTPRQKLDRLEARHIESVQDTKFDLHCYLTQYENGIDISCHYFKERFFPETIEKIASLYVKVLENIAHKPGIPIGEYSFTGKKKILKRKN